MIVRIIVFLSLIIPTMLGQAIDLTLSSNGVIKYFPECDAINAKVKYILSHKKVEESGFTIAFGVSDNQNPLIYIDPDAFSDAPPEFQIWVTSHECYHHKAVHRELLVGYNPAFKPEDENRADQWATLQTIVYGFTDAQLKIIYNTIMDENFHIRHQSNIVKFIYKNISLQNALKERANIFKDAVIKIRSKQYGRPYMPW